MKPIKWKDASNLDQYFVNPVIRIYDQMSNGGSRYELATSENGWSMIVIITRLYNTACVIWISPGYPANVVNMYTGNGAVWYYRDLI